MLKEMIHFAAFAAPAIAMKWVMDPARFQEILVAREDRAGMGERRRTLTRNLQGRILEIGCGAGGLFPYYPAGARVMALEPSPAHREQAERAARSAAADIQVVPGAGEALPFGDGSFHHVVGSMVLCSVGSVERVLSEARRVLRPGGTLHLIEHVRSERPLEGALMDLVNPLWQFFYRTNCNVNRDVDHALDRAGFRSREETRFKIFCRGTPALPMKLVRAQAPPPSGPTSGWEVARAIGSSKMAATPGRPSSGLRASG